MKAQWDYEGPHAQERLRREGQAISVTGKLLAVLVLVVVFSHIIFAASELPRRIAMDILLGSG